MFDGVDIAICWHAAMTVEGNAFENEIKFAGPSPALTSSTALTAVISLTAAVVSFSSQAAARDARDYIHDDGNVTWNVSDSFADDWTTGVNNTGVTACIKDGAKVSVGRRAIIAGLGGLHATVTVSGPGAELSRAQLCHFRY